MKETFILRQAPVFTAFPSPLRFAGTIMGKERWETGEVINFESVRAGLKF
jgi:hypothetical protein